MSKLLRRLTQTCAAVSLAVAAALPAQAAFVYTMDVFPGYLGDHGDFTLTVNQLITTNTTFQLSDFDAIDPLPGATAVSFEFGALGSDDVQVLFLMPNLGQGLFWSYAGALKSPGTYCAGLSNDCTRRAGAMTITETTNGVPEPAALALLGAAVAAAGLARRSQRARV